MTGGPARAAVAAALAVVLAGATGCATTRSGESAPPVTDSAAAAPDVAPCPELPRSRPVEGGLPPLTLPCLGEGPGVRLSDLRGTPTVVNVWAAWCINCDREMPLFARAVSDYGDTVRFFGIHYKASRDAGLASEVDFGVPFPSVHDEDGDRVARQLRAGAPPQTLFVDSTGRIVGRKIGEIRSQQEMRELVERYLGVVA